MAPETNAQRGHEVRRRLLAATVALIGEKGWNAVSTRMVAERAGVRSGIVHYHFTSVAALLREASLGTVRQILTGFAPILRQYDDATAGIDSILDALDRYSGRDATSLLMFEAYLAATRDAELRAELSALVAEFRDLVADWLAERGQAAPRETAAVLAATLDGFVLHKALDPNLSAEVFKPVLRRILHPVDESEN
ncbi:TetR/AcrR family transcriptional regulator [Stackebrandtia nassauensis]|uniref:Transcriptional regulator, TetR family n=1 Tax=Stackebrandtia nassauensis (strain DSM 44728 / CIP 108903 / NRRL B-16338 / NBRC 102104 / LLR-40K-21) TaxID=446470 RepID=D3PYW5_STANL|nr:TetR family transcriptional regulator [Stackebrandtia nassauensis]ADD43548.1 transcriptional regulator, TetR family [Stackebrandtia nassauensis DSM 44728]